MMAVPKVSGLAQLKRWVLIRCCEQDSPFGVAAEGSAGKKGGMTLDGEPQAEIGRILLEQADELRLAAGGGLVRF
jgi:hypothetical protein